MDIHKLGVWVGAIIAGLAVLGGSITCYVNITSSLARHEVKLDNMDHLMTTRTTQQDHMVDVFNQKLESIDGKIERLTLYLLPVKKAEK